jgi:hypothetical protein
LFVVGCLWLVVAINHEPFSRRELLMYVSVRAAKVRNLLVSAANGSITLVILLVAPLGLAAVIINTLLVTVATYAVSSVADRAIAWLSSATQVEFLSESNSSSRSLRRQQRDSSFMERRRQ